MIINGLSYFYRKKSESATGGGRHVIIVHHWYETGATVSYNITADNDSFSDTPDESRTKT